MAGRGRVLSRPDPRRELTIASRRSARAVAAVPGFLLVAPSSRRDGRRRHRRLRIAGPRPATVWPCPCRPAGAAARARPRRRASAAATPPGRTRPRPCGPPTRPTFVDGGLHDSATPTSDTSDHGPGRATDDEAGGASRSRADLDDDALATFSTRYGEAAAPHFVGYSANEEAPTTRSGELDAQRAADHAEESRAAKVVIHCARRTVADGERPLPERAPCTSGAAGRPQDRPPTRRRHARRLGRLVRRRVK